MSNFRNEFKTFIKSQLETKFSTEEYTFSVTNDQNKAFADKWNIVEENKIIVILSSGNATQSNIGSSFSYFNNSISMTFLVPMDKKESFIEKLDEMTTSLNTQTSIKRLSNTSNIYCSFNINSASSDGIDREFGGQYPRCLINVLGTVSYFNSSLQSISKGMLDDIYLGNPGVKLENIVSIKYNRNQTKDSQIVIGNMFESANTLSEHQTITITLLLNLSNALHSNLYNASRFITTAGGTLFDSKQNIRIVDANDGSKQSSFTGYLEFDNIIERGNFTSLTLTITR